MIYLIYLLVAAIIIFLANKASLYVDLIEKKTNLSGAFVGGVLLSAVTSLPELFTSISSTMFLHKPDLCMGNILGSNLFNIVILAALILVFFKSFNKVTISKSHIKITFSIFFIYITIIFNMLRLLNFEVLKVSISSVIIVMFYIYEISNMSSEKESEIAVEKSEQSLSINIKTIIIKFILVSIGIVTLSIIITYITDDISNSLNLGSGLAGAIFLGIATSLPEVSSTISLFKIKNFNIAFGNILGSNLFNFVILAITDILYIGKGIYDFKDSKTISLLFFGLITTILMVLILKVKNNALKFISSVAVILCYFGFLLG